MVIAVGRVLFPQVLAFWAFISYEVVRGSRGTSAGGTRTVAGRQATVVCVAGSFACKMAAIQFGRFVELNRRVDRHAILRPQNPPLKSR